MLRIEICELEKITFQFSVLMLFQIGRWWGGSKCPTCKRESQNIVFTNLCKYVCRLHASMKYGQNISIVDTVMYKETNLLQCLSFFSFFEKWN